MADLPVGDIQVVIRDGTSDSEYLVKVLSNGELSIGGGIASGATDSGNPIKVGGIFITTPPTLTTGQRGTLQLDANQNIKVNMVAGANGSIRIQDGTTTQLATVDTQGRLLVFIPPSASNIPIELAYDSPASSPVNGSEWQDVLVYTVPATYDLNCVNFQSNSSSTGDKFRAVDKLTMGTFDTSTGVFTPGGTKTLPEFMARMTLLVTTAIGSSAPDLVTITYTNQAGVAGRTANVTVPKSSLVGTRLEIILQGSDFGMTAITNVTHTITQAGVLQLAGNTELFYQVMLSVGGGNVETIAPLSSTVLHAGDTVYLQYWSSATGAKVRRVALIGTLVPRST